MPALSGPAAVSSLNLRCLRPTAMELLTMPALSGPAAASSLNLRCLRPTAMELLTMPAVGSAHAATPACGPESRALLMLKTCPILRSQMTGS